MSEKPKIDTEALAAEKAHAALIARLEALHRKPRAVRPPQSLQPTPEAAKSRVRRLRRKQQLLLQRSKRPIAPQSSSPRS